MKYMHKKKSFEMKLVGILGVILLALFVTFVTLTFYININNKAIEKELIQLNEKVTETKASITIIQEYIADVRENQVLDRTSMTEAESNALMSTLDVIDPIETPEAEREVIFSNYSIDDESGVNESGALGIGIKDFNVNDEGWYEYQGKVALACAMERRGDVREGYRHWEPLEELAFNFEGKDHQGICVDTGLAMLGWKNETEQRIDIWVTDQSANFGLAKGIVYE